jgi:hypothetical protein
VGHFYLEPYHRSQAVGEDVDMNRSEPNALLILWTSADRELAINMAFMYGLNSRLNGWWDEVTLLVWGPSSPLLTKDAELQQKVADMKAAGVRVIACQRCAENYGIVDQLTELGLEVSYVGEFLTEWIKSGRPVLAL